MSRGGRTKNRSLRYKPLDPAYRLSSERHNARYCFFADVVGWVDVVDVRELVLFSDARRC